MKTLDELKGYIKKTEDIEANGKSLDQQSYENYIENVLDMEVIKAVQLDDRDSYGKKFGFEVKSRKEGFNSIYKFVGEFHRIEDFMPREGCLKLKEISGIEGTHEMSEIFYFASENNDEANKIKHSINTPLAELISGEQKDKELSFLLSILKETFKGKFGYKYSEEEKGINSTFSIDFKDKEVSINMGFGNTIQIDFRKKSFDTIQIIFREKSQSELRENIEKLYNFLESYFNWNVLLDEEHSVSELYDFLSSNRILGSVKTNVLVNRDFGENTLLFSNNTIGLYDSYKQISFAILYDSETKQLKLKMNYLFQGVELLFSNVDDLKIAIEEIENLVI